MPLLLNKKTHRHNHQCANNRFYAFLRWYYPDQVLRVIALATSQPARRHAGLGTPDNINYYIYTRNYNIQPKKSKIF